MYSKGGNFGSTILDFFMFSKSLQSTKILQKVIKLNEEHYNELKM